jgi:hypothetical protein
VVGSSRKAAGSANGTGGSAADPGSADPGPATDPGPAAPPDGGRRSSSGSGDGEGPSLLPLPTTGRRAKRAKLSFDVRLEALLGDPQLGRLIDSTIWVNEAHPAYRRAKATRAEAYHLALTVASALAPLAVEAERRQDFVNRFLASWGEAAFARRRG